MIRIVIDTSVLVSAVGISPRVRVRTLEAPDKRRVSLLGGMLDRTGITVKSPGLQERENGTVPTISEFYGIVIRMYFNDHGPAHFHARYGEFEATIDVESLTVSEGDLPRRALDLVAAWAQAHQQELRENWVRCREKQSPKKVDPLV